MFKKYKRRINAYKKFAAELKLQEERQKQYEALVGSHLSYPIIQDLVNSATNNVTINIIMKDGTNLQIVKKQPQLNEENPYERLNSIY